MDENENANGSGHGKFTSTRVIIAVFAIGCLVALSYFLMGKSSSDSVDIVKETKPVSSSSMPGETQQDDCGEWKGYKRAGLITVPKFVKKLMINIGSWKDPPISSDPDTYTIAIEPQLKTAMKIADHPRLFIVTAAVSNVEGLAFMHAYGSWGESSSLTPANKSEPWGYDWAVAPQGYPAFQYVPVLSLRTILESIPESVEITQLKTDMQGQDFAAISHAGKSLRRVQSVLSEVYCNGFQTYEGVKNDLSDFQAFMPTVGFTMSYDPCGTSRRESDATFARDDSWVDKGK
jgi:hypothetical protein